jgi:hypothetical protein
MLPIVVAPVDGGAYAVIDGCKRHRLLKSAGARTCECLVTGPMSPVEQGLLRLALNGSRSRTLRETVCFARWLRRHVTPEDECIRRAGSVGLDREELLLADLTDTAVRAVARGILHAQNARAFSRLTPRDQQTFVEAFDGYRLSRQTQRELVEWLSEIACSGDRTVSDLLLDPKVKRALSDTNLTSTQALERVRDHIFQQRFPTYTRAYRRWESAARTAVPTPGAIRFVPSEGFEKDALEVRMRVDSPREAQRLAGMLRDIDEDTWATLIHPAGS